MHSDLTPLVQTDLLTPDEEHRLFRRLKMHRERIAAGEADADCRSRFERIRNRIVTANLRLLVSVARPFVSSELPLDDLVSAGMMPLIRAVELFDPQRGFRFSTYATHAVRNHLLRVRRKKQVQCRRENSVNVMHVEQPSPTRAGAESPLETAEELAALRTSLAKLDQRDRSMLKSRFGFGRRGKPQTFREMSNSTGLSRERVRVLTHRAVQRLRVEFQRQFGDSDVAIVFP